MERIFAYIGNWGMSKEPVPLGLSAAAYDPETGSMEILQQDFPQIKAGAICPDPRRKILCCVDERRRQIPVYAGSGQQHDRRVFSG